jgi:hypothetical protein
VSIHIIQSIKTLLVKLEAGYHKADENAITVSREDLAAVKSHIAALEAQHQPAASTGDTGAQDEPGNATGSSSLTSDSATTGAADIGTNSGATGLVTGQGEPGNDVASSPAATANATATGETTGSAQTPGDTTTAAAT